VAQVTGALAKAGLDILELDSDVGGTASEPLYIMHIEGIAGQGIAALEEALVDVRRQGIEGRVMPIDTVLG
jgi:glycine cleavage system transcriptional repressor